MGDSVNYAGLGDQLRVGASRLFSKKFNKEFKTLKDDENTFTFDRMSTKESGIIKTGEKKLFNKLSFWKRYW